MDIQIRNRIMAAFTAFKEPNLIMNLLRPADFDSWDSRLNRYEINWAFYENTAYNNIHSWAVQYKLRFGLYRYIRNIYNPANRLANFHQTYIWGGLLDPEAGDGNNTPSALPIITDNDNIRPAIANIWQWSNWQTKKDLVTLFGAVMGDYGVRVVDDTERGKVYLEVVNPRLIKELNKDTYGNVKSYVIEEQRVDPDNNSRMVCYTEIAKRGDNGEVIFETYKDNVLYAWNGMADKWEEDYGFIPFVHGLHIDVGTQYGWSEFHAGRGKFQEIDDLASKLNDFIRKATEGLFLFSGANKPQSVNSATASSTDKPQPGREDMPGLWGGADAKAQPLLHDLDISATLANITALADEIERDYPELMLDESAEVTAPSGRALRIKQQPAARKIDARRASYDNNLVKAQKMALSIGALRGYSGFEGLPVDGYYQGSFDHHIGRRPVFMSDRIDELEESNMFWQNATLAMSAGIDLSAYLRSEGWSDNQIRDVMKVQSRAQSIAARRAARTQPPVNEQATQPVSMIPTNMGDNDDE